MLAAVVPYALEKGLVKAQGHTSTFKVLTLNTNMVSEIEVQTPHGQITYEGDATINGVPGSSAPITINFLDVAGSVAGSLLPTGNLIDTFDIEGFGSLEATCIDNGMPMILIRAKDVNRTGYESVDALNQDTELKEIVEKLRLVASEKMGLGDVSDKNYPKMGLLAESIDGGAVHTRCYIPHMCHEAIGVLAAVTVATACILPNTVAAGIAKQGSGLRQLYSIEHPTGEFSVDLALNPDNPTEVVRAALLRTARALMVGEVYVPARAIAV